MSDDARDDDRPAYGTAAQDAPVTRHELERALRYLNLADLDLRDTILKLAGHVVALTDELVRRVDKLEPAPAPEGTPAVPSEGTIEQAVALLLPESVTMTRASDEKSPGRVALDGVADKYTVPSPDIPCAELIPLCHARCCQFGFSLSTQDLDEGVIRWDYGQPYLIRQRSGDGYCVHNDPSSHGCTVHQFRPRVCRIYDCREDLRIWIDYEKRIPAETIPAGQPVKIDLFARMKARFDAIENEQTSMRQQVMDVEPARGPAAESTLRPPTKK
jgi:hypothetical protein